jgi:hypothetical protein
MSSGALGCLSYFTNVEFLCFFVRCVGLCSSSYAAVRYFKYLKLYPLNGTIGSIKCPLSKKKTKGWDMSILIPGQVEIISPRIAHPLLALPCHGCNFEVTLKIMPLQYMHHESGQT